MELKRKSFEDLHCLWYVSLKELNVLATQEHDARRQHLPFLGRYRRRVVWKERLHVM